MRGGGKSGENDLNLFCCIGFRTRVQVQRKCRREERPWFSWRSLGEFRNPPPKKNILCMKRQGERKEHGGSSFGLTGDIL